MWYAFKAWNQETHYGWTTDPAVAEAVVDSFNDGRDINLYAAYPLGETDEEANEAAGRNITTRDCYVCTDDTHLVDGVLVHP